MKTYRYNAPFGIISFQTNENRLISIQFTDPLYSDEEDPLSQEIRQQLDEYFIGTRKIFIIPLYLEVTPFKESVYDALQTIPYGETRTYKEIATMIDNPKACRAVGNANNKNPIPIIIPCHRVVGTNGDLVGYVGGIEIKRYLLELERNSKDL